MKQCRNMLFVVSLALLTLLALGCSNVGYNNGVVTTDVTVSAVAMNKIVDNARIDSDSFVGKVEQIDFIEPNIMRVTGEFKMLGKDQKGSVDFAITTGDGRVQVDAVNSTIAGVDGNSKVVRTFSNALESALNVFASKDGKGGVTDVKVADGKLVLTVAVKIK